jgi:hypothetical protein
LPAPGIYPLAGKSGEGPLGISSQADVFVLKLQPVERFAFKLLYTEQNGATNHLPVSPFQMLFIQKNPVPQEIPQTVLICCKRMCAFSYWS